MPLYVLGVGFKNTCIDSGKRNISEVVTQRSKDAG